MSPLTSLLATTAPVTDRAAAAEVEAACAEREPCSWFLDWTGSQSTAEVLDLVLAPLAEVAMVLLLVAVARVLLRRLVGTVVRQLRTPVGAGALSRIADRLDGDHDAARVASERRARRAESMGALVQSVGNVLIWTFAVIMVLGAFDFELGPLIAGAGIVGVALGFGAQDLVKDFLSGVFMLVEDQYGVGDVVDVGDAAGVVEGISLRTTRVRDVEGRLWHVPNGEIRRVANSSQAWARALLDVDIAYDADIDEAIRVIEEAGRQMAAEERWDELFLEDPEVWGVENLAADSVQLRIVIKTRGGEQFAVGRELRRRIKYALDAAGIEIPFQQRTVWVRHDDGDGTAPGKATREPTVTTKATTKKAATKKAATKKAATKKAATKKAATRKAATKKAATKKATDGGGRAKEAGEEAAARAATSDREPDAGGARGEV